VADLDLAHWLSYLGPHGVGNPGPLFLARGVRLDAPKRVGERHIKVRLASAAGRLDAIAFGLADRHPPEALSGGLHDVLYRLEKNEWQGTTRAQAKLVDVRPSAAATPAAAPGPAGRLA
jgi:single-stranded-DNA-specific exonuclease